MIEAIKKHPRQKITLVQFPPWSIQRASENGIIYEPFNPSNKDDAGLIESIQRHGIKNPLRISRDGILLDGHRRLAAAWKVAENYTIPVTAGKGFASLPPRYKIIERHRASGKDKLILIFLTDFDPDGEQIATSFARSLRDDFGLDESLIVPVKAALTAQQVQDNDLPSSLEAKASSPNFKRFVAKYGTRAVELDAMPGALLEQVLRESIDSVLDVAAFNHEVEQERMDCQNIRATRDAALAAMGSIS